MTALASPLAPAVRPLRAAAVGFSLAWIAGLALPVPSVDVGAPGADVLAALDGHEAATGVRAVLVHGLAAACVLAVAWALARSFVAAGHVRLGRAARIAGATAAALSVAQLGLELVLVAHGAHGSAGTAAMLANLVNHLDGLKMLALASLAGTTAVAVARTAVAVPRLLGAVLAATLVVSAAGYGLLLGALAPAAFVSLPLLLVWVTWTGLALARAER